MKTVEKRILKFVVMMFMFVCALGFTSMTSEAASKNIPSGAAYNSANGHYYYLYDVLNSSLSGEKAFSAAEKYCESKGGHLATMTSASENKFVYNVMKDQGYSSAYFGFTDEAKEGTWKWVTGEKVSYTNWGSGEPNNERGAENYGMYYPDYGWDYGWNDGDYMCGTGGSSGKDTRAFICEWDTKAKKGAKRTVKGSTYKITKGAANGSGTVTYSKPSSTSNTNVKIPATVKIDGISYKVTRVGNKAFYNCKKLKTVTIGKNVKTIGKQAFYKCTKLKTVTLGKNVKTISENVFYGCKKITSITIPSKVSKIGEKSFYKCSKLKTITIKSKKLKSVGKKAFKGIKSTATIKVPKSKVSAYKKLLKGKGQSSKVKIKQS